MFGLVKYKHKYVCTVCDMGTTAIISTKMPQDGKEPEPCQLPIISWQNIFSPGGNKSILEQPQLMNLILFDPVIQSPLFAHTTKQNKGKQSLFTGWVCCTTHWTWRDPGPANVEQRPHSGHFTWCADDTQIFLTELNPQSSGLHSTFSYVTETQGGDQ